jgi:hypothetical protein
MVLTRFEGERALNHMLSEEVLLLEDDHPLSLALAVCG